MADALFEGAIGVEVVADSILGSMSREPGIWKRIGEASIAGAVGNVISALFLALASPPAHDAANQHLRDGDQPAAGRRIGADVVEGVGVLNEVDPEG